MKKTLVIAVCFVMLFTLVFNAGAAETHNAYYNGEVVNCSQIIFADSNGNEIHVLPSAGNVYANVRIINISENDTVGLTFMLASYKSGVFVNYATQEITLTENIAQDISLGIDVSGADELKAFVFDNASNIRPYAEKAISSEKAMDIKDIKIDGKSIDGFDSSKNTYNVTLGASYFDFPQIRPVVGNSAVKCEITYEGKFPLGKDETAKATLDFVSPDGKETKQFVINFTQKLPEVTNLKSKDSAATIQENLRNPVFKTEPEEELQYQTQTPGYGSTNIADYAPIFNNRGYPMNNIPAKLVGATYINTPLEYSTTYSYANGNDTLDNGVSFTINRTADIYIAVQNLNSSWISEQGFTAFNEFYLGYIVNVQATGAMYLDKGFFKKTVEVKNGETVDVKLGPVRYVVIDFKNAENISHASAELSGGSTSLNVVRKIYSVDILKPGDYLYNRDKETVRDGIKLVTDREYYLSGISDNLSEGELIAFPYNLRGKNPAAREVNSTDFVSFDIERSTDVYVFYPSQLSKILWMKSLGFEKVAGEDFYIDFLCNGNISRGTSVFKKSYEVNPGEKVKVNLGGFPVAEGSVVPLTIIAVTKAK